MRRLGSLILLFIAAAAGTLALSAPASAQDGARPPALPADMTDVVSTSQRQRVAWRYTFDRPADDWTRPGFDDGAWKQGPGGFGTPGTPGAVVGTTWNTSDVWLRRAVTLPGSGFEPVTLQLLAFHDEDVEVYIDGVLAAREAGFITRYDLLDILPAARALLKPGARLVLAVHCHQTAGGQGIDVGIVSVAPGAAERLAANRRRDRYRAFALSHRGDATNGQRLFLDEQRLACSKCHTTDGSASRAGPDLRAAGETFSRRDLVDAVLNPSANIAVGYTTTVVKTKSGDVYDGVLKDADADGSVGLMGADGKLLRLRADQVRSAARPRCR